MKKNSSFILFSSLFLAIICIFSSCYIPRNGLYENEKGKRYFENDVYKSGWIEIEGEKYYFSKLDGYMITDPTEISGQLYYFNSDGRLVNGFYDIKAEDGSAVRIYCEDGLSLRGWQIIDGKKYYFYVESGYMATGDLTISGQEYSFDSDGSLKGYNQ